MAWKKSSPELIALFEKIIPPDPLIEPRKMFGYPCCFVAGNMMMGLHQENLILRLPKEDREKFLEMAGTSQFEPMAGHVMKEYVAVSDELKADIKQLAQWVMRSFDYVKSLPPKVKRKRA